MRVTVLIPYRDVGCEWRRHALERTTAHIVDSLGWRVEIVDAPGEPFSRGAALNAGARRTDADVIVAHDGDVLLPADRLRHAVEVAYQAPGLVQPFDSMIYTDQATARRVCRYITPVEQARGERWELSSAIPMLGTVNVLSRDTWDMAGGWLERFRGWGCEDVAFAAQCEQLAGPLRRLPGSIVHLYHPKGGEYAAPDTIARNRDVMADVLDAGTPEAMADLVRRNQLMMRTRYVILAAGEGTRWGNHFDRPKHFAPLLGEHLIERVVRQVQDRDPSGDIRVIVRDLDDDRYNIPGTRRHVATQHPECGNAAKLISSAHAWHRTGRTVVLLGDVFYTDEAMDTIVGYDARDWCLFGRPTGSRFSGKPWNENFALSFWSEHHDLIHDATARVVALHDAGVVGRLSHSTWFRAAVGVADEQVGKWDTDPQRFGHFTVIDDWTEDIDSPQDYQKWCYAWAKADPATRPSRHG